MWLVAFDQEEWGMLGSTALAAEPRQAGQRLQLMVSQGMLGNIGAGRFLPRLALRVERHVSAKVLPVPHTGRSLPDVRLSDHSPFWDAGYDAVMVTDTSSMRKPNDHLMSGTIDSLDPAFLASVTEVLDAVPRALRLSAVRGPLTEALNETPGQDRGRSPAGGVMHPGPALSQEKRCGTPQSDRTCGPMLHGILPTHGPDRSAPRR